MKLTRRAVLGGMASPLLVKPAMGLMRGTAAPPPPAAAAWGYTTRNFFDDFTAIGSIDQNNTAAAGYQWYPHNAWPNAVNDTDNGNIWRTASPTPAGAISVSGSVLTLATDASTFSQGLNTAVANGAGYLGRTFTNGFYIEVIAAFDPSVQFGGSWPGWWTVAVEFLLGTNSTFGEMDIFEPLPQGGSVVAPVHSIHLWVISGGHHTDTLMNANSLSLGAVDFNTMHTYGMLWVPAAKNAGTGLNQFYFDNTHITSVDLSYAAASTFGTAVDNQHFPVIISAGLNWPARIDRVSVWQQSSLDMTTH
jgi:hypothetical protein